MTYPEHEKLSKVRDHSQAIGEFLDWASEKGWSLAEWDEDDLHLWPVRKSVQEILAEYFKIDLVKLEDEKRAMLDEIRSKQ